MSWAGALCACQRCVGDHRRPVSRVSSSPPFSPRAPLAVTMGAVTPGRDRHRDGPLVTGTGSRPGVTSRGHIPGSRHRSRPGVTPQVTSRGHVPRSRPGSRPGSVSVAHAQGPATAAVSHGLKMTLAVGTCFLPPSPQQTNKPHPIVVFARPGTMRQDMLVRVSLFVFICIIAIWDQVWCKRRERIAS